MERYLVNIPRICIVGAGGLSTRRIYPYLGAAGAHLVGVCDLDQAKAQRNATLFGGTPYRGLEAMLAEQKPDGVIICIGPEQHAKLAVQVLQLGFPVYTEKPPAASAEAALEVARVAKATGLLCTTAFKKRYTEAANRAKAWLAKHPPNDWYSISVDYCSGGYSNKTPREDFLLDFSIHVIDLVSYLFGEASEVFAFTKDCHAYAVSLRFANGAVGSMNLNDGRVFHIPTEEIEITARGGNFMTIHNSSCWRLTENGQACEWREPPTFISTGDSGKDTGHLAELEDFVQALAQDRHTTRSNIYEGYKTMALYEAIRASALSGEKVRVNYQTLS